MTNLSIIGYVYWDECPFPILKFPNLKHLNISGNFDCNSANFHSLIKKVLMQLPNLKKLILADNCLEELHNDFFDSSVNLIHLNLSENQLVVKSGQFKHLSNLKCLDLSKNRMTKLEDGVFLGLKNLEELDLRGNDLDEMSLCQLDELKSLKKLKFDKKSV